MSSSKSSGTDSGKSRKTGTSSGSSSPAASRDKSPEKSTKAEGLSRLFKKPETKAVEAVKPKVEIPAPPHGELNLYAWDVMGAEDNGLGKYYDEGRDYKLVRPNNRLKYAEKGWREDAAVRDTSHGDIPLILTLISKERASA